MVWGYRPVYWLSAGHGWPQGEQTNKIARDTRAGVKQCCTLPRKASTPPYTHPMFASIIVVHIACEHDNGDVARLLLDAGAHVNERDKSGCTPLFTSVRAGGSPSTLRLLLEKGAEVDGTPDGEPTALALASGMGCLTTVRLLVR